MKFNYQGRIVEASSREAAIRKIAARTSSRRTFSKSTYRRPIEERDNGKDPEFKGVMTGISADALADRLLELKDYVESKLNRLGGDDVSYVVAIDGQIGPIDHREARKIASDLLTSRHNGMYGLDVVDAFISARLVLPKKETDVFYGSLVSKYAKYPVNDDTMSGLHDRLTPDRQLDSTEFKVSAPDLDVLIPGLDKAKAEYDRYIDQVVREVEDERIPDLRQAFEKAKAEAEGIAHQQEKRLEDDYKYQERMRRGKYMGNGDPLTDPNRFGDRRFENNKKAVADLLNKLPEGTELTFSDMDDDQTSVSGGVTIKDIEDALSRKGGNGTTLYIGPTYFDIRIPDTARLNDRATQAIEDIMYGESSCTFHHNDDGTYSCPDGVFHAFIGAYVASLTVDLAAPGAVEKVRDYVNEVSQQLKYYQRKADAIVKSSERYARDVARNPSRRP